MLACDGPEIHCTLFRNYLYSAARDGHGQARTKAPYSKRL